MEFTGLDKIPADKPIVLAANHSNAMIDPIIIGMISSRKVRFFARGDVFKGRLTKWALNSMNMSPMYRIQEGYSELKKNNKTFEECSRLLSNNKTLLLFPEAICVQERRLRPLKKGLSRIIFQTEETFEFKKDVLVVPIGLNYFNPTKFGSKLFVEFGSPVSLRNFESIYKQDKVKTINDFTKLLELEMSKLLVVIKNGDNDKLVESIEEIYTYYWLKEQQLKDSIEKQFQVSKEIAKMINYYDETNPSIISSLKEKIIPYLNELEKHKLRDHLLRPETINNMNLGTFFIEYLLVYFGMPLYYIGMCLNYPPYYFGKFYTDKNIKQLEFQASIHSILAMLSWVIFYGIQLLIVAVLFHNWLALGIYAILVPLCGLFVLKFYRIKKKIAGRWRLLKMVRKDRATVETLIKTHTGIVEQLKRLNEEFLLNNLKK